MDATLFSFVQMRVPVDPKRSLTFPKHQGLLALFLTLIKSVAGGSLSSLEEESRCHTCQEIEPSACARS
jgi:hypothetical protein